MGAPGGCKSDESRIDMFSACALTPARSSAVAIDPLFSLDGGNESMRLRFLCDSSASPCGSKLPGSHLLLQISGWSLVNGWLPSGTSNSGEVESVPSAIDELLTKGD